MMIWDILLLHCVRACVNAYHELQKSEYMYGFALTTKIKSIQN